MSKMALWVAIGLMMGLALLAPEPASATPTTYTGTVTKVTDGDTFTVRYLKPNGRYASIVVRSRAIDTPERTTWFHKASGTTKPAECWGPEAAAIAKSTLLGKSVTVVSYGLDAHGRHLAETTLPSGVRFEHWMLEQGHAAIYKGQKQRLDPEDAISWAAREANRGMWGKCGVPGHNGRLPMAPESVAALAPPPVLLVPCPTCGQLWAGE
jgi:endonuclease YncB( thermonuclease family)